MQIVMCIQCLLRELGEPESRNCLVSAQWALWVEQTGVWAEERSLGNAGQRHISEYAIFLQVHTFDPFLSTGTEAAVQGRPGLQFHPVGILGSADGRVGSGGPEHWQSLENIMTDMGHEWLEVTNKLPVDEKAQTFVFPAARTVGAGRDEPGFCICSPSCFSLMAVAGKGQDQDWA